MTQEAVTGLQKATGWLFVGSGPLAWVTQNATALTALASVITGTIFAVCAILNMMTNKRNAATNKAVSERNAAANEERNRINKRDIADSIMRELEHDLQYEEIEKVKNSLRK